jgi:hypothetical protein
VHCLLIAVGSFGGVFASYIVDRRHNHKTWLVALFTISTVATLLFGLVCAGIFPASLLAGDGGLALLFIFATISGWAIGTTSPIFYELVRSQKRFLPMTYRSLAAR